MKKLFTLFMALVLLLSLVACGSSISGPDIETDPEPTEDDKPEGDGTQDEQGEEPDTVADPVADKNEDVEDPGTEPSSGGSSEDDDLSPEELEALFEAAYEDEAKVGNIPSKYADLFVEYVLKRDAESAQSDSVTPPPADTVVEIDEHVSDDPTDPDTSDTSDDENFTSVSKLAEAPAGTKAYKECDVNSPVVGTVGPDELVQLRGEGTGSNSGWCKVMLSGMVVGYMPSSSLTPTHVYNSSTDQYEPITHTTTPSTTPSQQTSPSQQTTPSQQTPPQQTTPSQQTPPQSTQSTKPQGKTADDVMVAHYTAGTKVWILCDAHVTAKPDGFSEDVGMVHEGETYILLEDMVYGISWKDGHIAKVDFWCYKIQLADGTIGYIDKAIAVDFDFTQTVPAYDNTAQNIAYAESIGCIVTLNETGTEYTCIFKDRPNMPTGYFSKDAMRYSKFYSDARGVPFCGQAYDDTPPYNSPEGVARLKEIAVYAEEHRHSDYSPGYQAMQDAYDRLTGGTSSGQIGDEDEESNSNGNG